MFNNLKKINKNLQSKFFFNYDLSNYTWFRTGGRADLFCIVSDENELEIILNNIESGTPLFVIGMGSNVLIRDGGFRGLIIKLGRSFNIINNKKNIITVGASILDTNLSKFALLKSIQGFEFLSSIPGSIGGAIKMNAGCFGYETKDILKKINIIDKKGIRKNINNKDLAFSYRNSNLLDNQIVISAVFSGEYGDKNYIQSKIKQIKKTREQNQPIKCKTGGSTFKNPKDLFAAKLIEQADCKGLKYGDAIVSTKHSNFLINLGNAKAKDIETLGMIVQERVMNKLNILLEWEIKIIGNSFE